MSEWLEIEKKLRKLEADVREKEKGVEHILEMLIITVRGMALQIDLDRLNSGQDPAQSAIKASLDETATMMLKGRMERIEQDQEWTVRDISRRLEKHFADLNKRLDTIEQRLPEPPS